MGLSFQIKVFLEQIADVGELLPRKTSYIRPMKAVAPMMLSSINGSYKAVEINYLKSWEIATLKGRDECAASGEASRARTCSSRSSGTETNPEPTVADPSWTLSLGLACCLSKLGPGATVQVVSNSNLEARIPETARQSSMADDEGAPPTGEYQLQGEHKYKLVSSYMEESFEQAAINISLVAVDKYKHLKDIAYHVKHEFDKKYPGSGKATEGVYHCVVGKNYA
eukprot:gene5811-6098_t